MKVAILAPGLGYDAGAIPIRARAAGNLLVKRGHEVIGLGLKMDGAQPAEADFPIEGLRAVRLPWPFASLSVWLTYELAVARRLIQISQKSGLDLVISHWQTFGLAGAIVRKRTRAKWVSLVQRTIYDTMKSGDSGPNWLMNAVVVWGCRCEFTYSDLVIALHQQMADEIREHVPTTGPIEIIPNGVDLRQEDFVSMWTAKNQQLILFAGRLEVEKCIDVVIHGFARCQSPDAELAIIGDGQLRGQLQALAADLGVDRRVRFLGAVPHDAVLSWMKQAGVFVLVSSSEGMPFTLLEAMAAACAIVCSSIPGNRALLDDAQAMFVDVGDDIRLGARLQQLLADPVLAEQYGGKAHERAKKFDWPTIIGREVALYERLVEEGRIAR